jgi:peptidyl-prolyl cis-trans isomerase C/peptidyl-prolyl cis-trans isomerase D
LPVKIANVSVFTKEIKKIGVLMKAIVLGFLLVLPSYLFAQNLAVVGEVKITLEDFKKKYAEIKVQAINPPPPELFLEDLIRYEIGVQEADKRGLRKDPIVQERFKQELYKALIEKELGKKVDAIKVTDAEMRAYYKRNPEYRSSHILIEYKPDATPEQKADAAKRAKEIYAEVIKSKRPFEELVKLYSDDSYSKMNGGDIGFQSRMTLIPTYYDTLAKLKMNEIGGPVQTPYGYSIVKLTGKNEYADANKKQIRAAVFDEKRKVIFDAYFAELKKKYTVIKDTDLLKKIK